MSGARDVARVLAPVYLRPLASPDNAVRLTTQVCRHTATLPNLIGPAASIYRCGPGWSASSS